MEDAVSDEFQHNGIYSQWVGRKMVTTVFKKVTAWISPSVAVSRWFVQETTRYTS